MKMSENNVLHTVPVVYHEVSDLNPTVQLLRSCGAGAALFLAGAGAAQTVRLQLHLLVNFQNWSTIEIRLTVLPKFIFLTSLFFNMP